MARMGSRRFLGRRSTGTPLRAAACATRWARKTPLGTPDTLTEHVVPARGRISIARTAAALSVNQVEYLMVTERMSLQAMRLPVTGSVVMPVWSTRASPIVTSSPDSYVAISGGSRRGASTRPASREGIGGGWVGHSPAELAAYQAARDEGRLHVRVELMVASDALHGIGAHPADGIELGLDLGIRTGFGDDWLRLGPMKIFTDGSLVGRTAAMSAPYDGQPGNSGYLQADAADLTATIIAAHRAGWRVAAHAIGDRAIDLALDAFETAEKRYPGKNPRHRIEHFAASRPDQVIRASERGVVAVPQGRFATELGDGMMAAVGAQRHSWLYRQRSLLDAGMVLPGSSDRPVAAGAPLLGIHDMVNRRAASGAPFNAAEAVSAEEALRAYTYGSAYASGQEHVKGTIEPGKLADFVVLSEDPAAVRPDRIAGLAVVATIIGGEIRYDAGLA